MANVLQDYFSRMNALNRQRGMTGNMQYGRSLDPSIAEGYFDSYQKNKLQSQTLANQSRGLDIQEKGVNADVSYKEWSKGFQEEELAAQIDYNNRMLGLRGQELANANAYHMGMLELGQQEAADRAWYNKESIGIQRENAASDRDYKMGMLSYQDRALAAQQSAADRAATLNYLGLGMNAATTLGSAYLGYKQNQASNARTDQLIAELTKRFSPETTQNYVLNQALSGGTPYQYQPQRFNIDPSLFSTSYRTFDYEGFGGYQPALYNPPDLSNYYTPPSTFWNNATTWYPGAYQPYDFGSYTPDYSYMSY